MADDVIDAERFEASSKRSNIQLNISLSTTIALSIVFLVLSGCLESTLQDSKSEEVDNWWDVPLHERHTMDLPMNTSRAQLPVEGTYKIRDYEEHFITVDLPASEQDLGYPEEAKMHLALWLPEVEEGVKVPVIMTIHPYYDFGGEGMPGVGGDSNPNTVPDGGVGQWVYETFVPHGYALAQASTFGTGKSTHCQDVKGLGEQVGIQAVVDWLGQQNWSNGNVGLMGKSYACLLYTSDAADD